MYWTQQLQKFSQITGLISWKKITTLGKTGIVWNLELTELWFLLTLVKTWWLVGSFYSFIQYSVWRQVQSLLQNDAST